MASWTTVFLSSTQAQATSDWFIPSRRCCQTTVGAEMKERFKIQCSSSGKGPLLWKTNKIQNIISKIPRCQNTNSIENAAV